MLRRKFIAGFIVLLVAFLRPFSIAAIILALFFMLILAWAMNPLVALFCLLIAIIQAVPYGIAGLVIQLILWLRKENEWAIKSCLPAFLYGGITGTNWIIVASNKISPCHEEPFVMPPWNELLQFGLGFGLFCGLTSYCVHRLWRWRTTASHD